MPANDDDILFQLACAAARGHDTPENHVLDCAEHSDYKAAAKQFLLMWRVMRNLGALERIEKEVDLR